MLVSSGENIAMRRLVPCGLLLLAATACRPYQSYGYVSSEHGLLPADEFASYGPDQATAIAIGRAFGHAYAGLDSSDYAKQTQAAMTYARQFPQVASVSADTLGHRLVVTFTSGWTAQVTPIMDNVAPDKTPGLPSTKSTN
jgi:hypothetical protein